MKYKKDEPQYKFSINPPGYEPQPADKSPESQKHKKALEKFEELQDEKLDQDYWDSL